MMFYLILITIWLFLFLSVAAAIFFIGNIFRYIFAKRKNKKVPDSFSEKKLHTIKSNIIISGIISAVTASVLFTFVYLIGMALSHM